MSNEKSQNRKESILKLTESGLMLALSTILSLIIIYRLPFGGSVTLFSQLPVIIIAYRHGLKWGLGTGFASGILQALLGLDSYAYIAKTFMSVAVFFLFDFLIAFSALGLGGIFKKHVKSQAAALSLGALLASFLRYICHVISGIAIWSAYAEDFFLADALKKILSPVFGNMEFWAAQSDRVYVYLYSICYNFAYMSLETAITIVGAVMISLVLNIKNTRIVPARQK